MLCRTQFYVADVFATGGPWPDIVRVISDEHLKNMEAVDKFHIEMRAVVQKVPGGA